MLRILVAKLLYWLLSWLKFIPIQKNKIILFSYQGRGCNCNPKYIAKQLLCENNNRHYDVFFAAKDINKVKEILGRKINVVRYGSISFLYHMSTAKIIVTNSSNLPWFPYKKCQVLINTWHGGGAYKSEWYDLRLTSFKNRRVDYFVSSSKKFTELLSKSTGLSSDKFINTGMPRNDLLVDSSFKDRNELLNRLGLNLEYKYLLYAPTYRDDNASFLFPDFEMVLKAFGNRFGGEWKLLVRGHYNAIKAFVGESNRLIYKDVSAYDDMQELLMISDAVITDYSSLIWDYSLLYRPCFLYVPDIDVYAKNRGFYYPLPTWGFPYAKTMDELVNVIEGFDEHDFVEKMNKHHENLQSYETGTASKKICDLIINKIAMEK